MAGRTKEVEPNNAEYRQHLFLQTAGYIREPNEYLELPDGRVIPAISAAKSFSTCSFRELYLNAFECVPRGTSAREAYFLTLELIAQHNQEHPNDRIGAFAVKYGGQFFYALPRGELEQGVELLRRNEAELEHCLPFRLSREEQKQLRRGRVETQGIAIRRLLNLGMRTTTSMGVPEGESVNLVIRVISHPSIWQMLLEAPLPIKTSSDFQRVFNTSVYRRALNYFRAKKNAEEMNRPLRFLDGSPLKDFFEENPPGSKLAKRILRLLPEKNRGPFVAHFLENKYGKEVYKIFGNTRPHTIVDRYVLARKRLEEIVKKPVQDWPKIEPVVAVEHLLADSPDFVDSFLAKLPPQLRERYEELIELKCRQGLANRKVAERMEMTEGAIKSLYHRFTRKLLEEALAENILTRQEVEL